MLMPNISQLFISHDGMLIVLLWYRRFLQALRPQFSKMPKKRSRPETFSTGCMTAMILADQEQN
jgi:hypothetical protein